MEYDKTFKDETKFMKLVIPIRYEEASDEQVPGKVVKYLWITNNVKKLKNPPKGPTNNRKSKKSREDVSISDFDKKDSFSKKGSNSFEKFEKYAK